MTQLPHDFAEDTRAILGEQAYAKLAQSILTETPPASLRLNPRKEQKNSPLPIEECFESPVSWATGAHYLKGRPSFTFDPLFHAGRYYVQEAASMCIEQAVRGYLEQPRVALDLCAAPGGKSTLLRTLLPEGCLLVSNEPMRPRAHVLAENLIKWGSDEVVVTQNFPDDFTPLPPLFDLILTDVPCSGEGMFRKDEQAISEWSRANVLNCQARQRHILEAIWPTLQPGGILIYSTCTFNLKENEENVAWIARHLGAEVLPLEVPAAWGITGNQLPGASFPVYRFMPGTTRGEGFFMAVLRKEGDPTLREIYTEPTTKKGKKGADRQKKGESAMAIPSSCRSWLTDAEAYELSWKAEQLMALPKLHLPLIQLFEKQLQVIHCGLPLGELRGKDIVPSHPLAMCHKGALSNFEQVELDYENAIAYLRKESIALPPTTPRGFVLFTYLGTPLGFGKNVGNRANNLYPQEWRIRSGYTPSNWLNPEASV